MDDALNYEQDLAIDPDALDVEWLDQPRRFMKYSRELADARERLSRAAERLDVAKADADARARTSLKAAGEAKPTVDMVKAAVQKDDAVQKGADAMIKAEHEVNMLQAAVKAFDQRKDALENLVRLHGQNYFAGPTVPREIGKEFAEHVRRKGQEEAREKAADRTRRRS